MKRAIATTLLTLLFSTCASAAGFEGLSVEQALRRLESQGLRLIFSTDLVTPDMRVAAEPSANDPERVLAEILEPHGLEAKRGPRRSWVVVRSRRTATIAGFVVDSSTRSPIVDAEVLLVGTDRRAASAPDGSFAFPRLEPGSYTVEVRAWGLAQRSDPITVGDHERSRVTLTLLENPFDLGEIVVTSAYSLYGEGPANRQALSKVEIDHLPHLGDDIFRATEKLPGVATTDIRASLHVRGSDEDEVLILLDGLEVLSPFHLDEFQRAFSVIDSDAVGSVELMTGGFPVEFGGRMGGVMDITFDQPPDKARFFVGTSFINSRIGGEGTFAEGKGSWLASYRRGYLDVILNYIDNDSAFRPSYGDLLLRAQYQVSDRTLVSANALVIDDDLNSFDDPQRVTALAEDVSLWTNVRTAWTSSLYSQTVASGGEIDRLRFGVDGPEYEVNDERTFDFLGVKQDWIWDVDDRHSIRAGFDIRKQKGTYDYVSTRTEIPLFGSEPIVNRIELDLDFNGTSTGLYVSDRFRMTDRLVVEAGVRFDDQTWLEDDPQISPRVSAALQLGEGTIVRASWGRFFQHQRLNELQIEDGVDELEPAQLSEQWIVGVERYLTPTLLIRVEAYQKELSRLIARWDNLYQPFEIFPEASFDRYLVDASEAETKGVEIFAKWEGRGPLSGFMSYTWSSADDIVDGNRVPRRWDQPHSISASLFYRRGDWVIGLSSTYHTGWPTTELSGTWTTDPNGSITITPEIGRVNAERYPDYLRLDLRASRAVDVRHGDLSWYLEIINVTDQNNRCCVDYFDQTLNDDGTVTFTPVYNGWLPIVPSFGITWTWP